MVKERADADFFASPPLHIDVSFRARIFTEKDDRESGRYREQFDFLFQLVLDMVGGFSP